MPKTPDGKDTNVLSKTPDEIKKGLGHCSNDAFQCSQLCPYFKSTSNGVDCASELHLNALAYIEQLEAQIPKWISYKEKSPQEAGCYLVHCIHWYSDTDGYECYKVACFDPKILWVNIGNLLKVTHWMPLPSMPKEERK